MPHKITEDCIACGACETECSSSSITLGASGIYVIDAATCTDCGNCANVCPVGSAQPA